MNKGLSIFISCFLAFQFLTILRLNQRLKSLEEIQRLDGCDLDEIKEKLHLKF